MSEIERRFLVSGRPDELPDGAELESEGTEIRQAYVAIDHPVSVRVRKKGSDYTIGIKSGRGLERGEVEVDVGAAEFEELWDTAQGRTIEKRRYEIPVGDHTAELDVFAGPLEGLVLVEVEFDDRDQAERFEPPLWFGRDVTDEPGWSNAELAVDGVPSASEKISWTLPTRCEGPVTRS